MADLDRFRLWSLHRQGLAARNWSVMQTLRGCMGVYSSHPTAPLSLLARSAGFTPGALWQLEYARLVARVPAMRSSIFLLLQEDAGTAFWATRTLADGANWPLNFLRHTGVKTEEGYQSIRRRILAAATEPISARDLSKLGGTEGRPVTPFLQVLSFEGDLLRVGSQNPRSNSLTYVAASVWQPNMLAPIDPSHALVLLAERYFRRYGPARSADFAWWAGVPLGKAEQAQAALDLVDVEDRYFLPRDSFEPFCELHTEGAGLVSVLPKWDCYTMGYAPDGRARLVPEQALSLVYASTGDGLPAILLDGQAVGTWRHKYLKNRLRIIVDAFDRVPESLRDKIEERFVEIAGLLGARRLELEWAHSDRELR